MLHATLSREIIRRLNNRQYERVDNGLIFVPKLGMFAQGVFRHNVNGLDERVDPNLVVDEGLNRILDVSYNDGTQITAWNIGLFTGSSTPASNWTGANITANSTEFTNYTQTTRQAWTSNGVSAGGVVSNSSATAQFTADTGGGTVWGAFLAQASAKSATTGVLNSASKFAGSRSLLAGDNLNISYTLTLTSTS